jgi:hypothetical protein
LTWLVRASFFSSAPPTSASASFLNWSEPASDFGRGILQRPYIVANGLDLALGTSQHVFDIGI